MKKIIYIFIFIFFVLSLNNNLIHATAVNTKSYKLKFKDCNLNTDNFIEKMNYMSDFKILKITPYNYDGKQYLFYSNNLNEILNEFKNKYIDNLLTENKYVRNICIKEVEMYTIEDELYKLKKYINFSY